MKIAVCLKQVPDTSKLRFDLQGNLSTDGVENILNPACGYAIEAAVRLKESQPAESTTITAFSVGPASAKDVLKRAVAMGADEAYLLNDPIFFEADPLGIARLLAAAIQKFCPDVDLILLGQFTDDGGSGITGPALAEVIGLPCITLANQSEIVDEKTAIVYRDTETAVEKHQMQLPGVICYANSEVEPRIPNIKGVMRANRVEIPSIDSAGLGLSADQLGMAVSPTEIAKQWRKPAKVGGEKIDGLAEPQTAVDQLLTYLQNQKLVSPR